MNYRRGDVGDLTRSATVAGPCGPEKWEIKVWIDPLVGEAVRGARRGEK